MRFQRITKTRAEEITGEQFVSMVIECQLCREGETFTALSQWSLDELSKAVFICGECGS